MALDIKTCGMKDEAAIEAALSRGASHVGFISFPRSPRHLEIEAMAALRRLVGSRALVTVVAVDPDDALLDKIVASVSPDWLQLHGHETPERVLEVKQRFSRPVMKAVSIGSAEDVGRVATYLPVADRLLLDAKRPKGSALPGGNGVSFDWRLLDALDDGTLYMLSGGLDAGNVGGALGRRGVTGLDVSSGLESAPGVKDVSLIHRFFDALEAAGQAPAPGKTQERKAS
ncbi:phosphoribosylanthranilate isomerase [Consotaella salsifontis]|uniref:N-(5'-phosphoribosyl)anthranilate isomerase n=1 Tax=Consotaella salsifontis TaxID=1365950 RepID=A0A1T4QIL4_9HYPH|nr:phosphoribosylanthranilate isomerase [Consotaella salsifontis]SKA03549.1 phosphoribosylanthranilate isomerase [Consotaella salsifontis]